MKLLSIFSVLCICCIMQLICGQEDDQPEQPEQEAEQEAEQPTEEPIPEKTEKKERPLETEERAFFPYLVPPYTTIVLGPADVPFGLFLGPHVRSSLALTENRDPADTVDFNLKIIERNFNTNYKNSRNLLRLLKKKFAKADKFLFVNKKGFHCNQKFCDKFGNGHHAFGICSSFSCKCAEGRAEGMKCKEGLVFDPLFQNCDNPLLVKICGF